MTFFEIPHFLLNKVDRWLLAVLFSKKGKSFCGGFWSCLPKIVWLNELFRTRMERSDHGASGAAKNFFSYEAKKVEYSQSKSREVVTCCPLLVPTKRIGLADFPEFSRSSKNCPFSNPNPCLLYSRKWQYCQICTFWTYFWVLRRKFFRIIWGF